jgi:hypothetical protein
MAKSRGRAENLVPGTMNILGILNDYRVPFDLRKDWANMPCPSCQDHAAHLGINVVTGQANCWRCGGKSLIPTLAKILRVDRARIIKILGPYREGRARKRSLVLETKKGVYRAFLPQGCRPLREVPGAVRYLEGRGFKISELESTWGVLATGPGSITRKGDKVLDLSYRIVAPVTLGGKIISYQCRDWTGKARQKYLNCLPELESIPLKSTLYGLDQAEGMDSATLVEGVTDAWAIGPGAVACFGIKHRPEQIRELAWRFQRIDVMFDAEAGPAKIQARKIEAELRQLGAEVNIVRLPKGKDPADIGRERLRKEKDL